jgi:hypothetical protein
VSSATAVAAAVPAAAVSTAAAAAVSTTAVSTTAVSTVAAAVVASTVVAAAISTAIATAGGTEDSGKVGRNRVVGVGDTRCHSAIAGSCSESDQCAKQCVLGHGLAAIGQCDSLNPTSTAFSRFCRFDEGKCFVFNKSWSKEQNSDE